MVKKTVKTLVHNIVLVICKDEITDLQLIFVKKPVNALNYYLKWILVLQNIGNVYTLVKIVLHVKQIM